MADLSRMPSLKQHRTLRAIDSLTRAFGFPPTIRELAIDLKVSSTNAVAEFIRGLHRRQLVTSRRGSPRTLRLTEGGRAWLEVSEGVLVHLLEANPYPRTGAPRGNRNSSREHRAAKAARLAAELADARGAA